MKLTQSDYTIYLVKVIIQFIQSDNTIYLVMKLTQSDNTIYFYFIYFNYWPVRSTYLDLK